MLKRWIAMGVLTPLLMAAPAAAAVKPGPVRVVFERAPSTYYYGDDDPRTITSQLFIRPGSGPGVRLTKNGAITWLGRASKNGRLTFPENTQVFPPVDIGRGFPSITRTVITGLTGTVKRSGEVTLRGRLVADVSSGSACTITTPVLLSTKAEDPSLPGESYDARTGAFAVADGPLWWESDSGCNGIPTVMPGIFLTGRLQLPGGPRIPESLRELDVYQTSQSTIHASPGRYTAVTGRIWTSQFGKVTVTANCTPGPALPGQQPVCKTQVGVDEAVAVMLSGALTATVHVQAVAKPTPSQRGVWRKGTWRKDFNVYAWQ